jgi:tetratricopeptide (TPR) repeat protein
MTRPSLILLAALVLGPTAASAQRPPSTAERIYADSSASVLLVETRNADNEPTGQATAFVVGRNLLITNAHAVGGATVWVKVGAINVPARIERTDDLNDLALLRLQAETEAPALAFSTTDPAPGARVFALGNPRGLEGTITEGLMTGSRAIDGRSVFQISAALSRGSSGGPVLNDRGEVVGVAVATLRDAQNIGFAVPGRIALKLIANEKAGDVDVAGARERVKALIAQRTEEDFSEQDNSRYQRLTRQIHAIVASLLAAMTSGDALHGLFAELELWEPALARDVAKRAVTLAPASATALRDLAEATRTVAEYEPDEPARISLYREAESVAAKALAAASADERRALLLLLGEIQAELPGRGDLAIAALRDAQAGAADDTAQTAWLALFNLYHSLKRFPEAKQSFTAARAIKSVPGGTYDATYGDVLEQLGEFDAAAETYLKGAEVDYSHACDASRNYWLGGKTDLAIRIARRCLGEASAATDGDADVAYAHRLLSHLMRERGVTDQAIGHARQAIAASPGDGFAFSALAAALIRAERWSEAETAARSAIRLTDGAHSYMHFALGSTLFALERWGEARAAFQQAATMNPKDAASAYNTGLSLLKLRFYRDAAKWLEEALRRDPRLPDAADVRSRIAVLRAQ